MNKKNITIDLSINLELDEKDFRDACYVLGGEDNYLRFLQNLMYQQMSEANTEETKLSYITAYTAEENNFDNN